MDATSTTPSADSQPTEHSSGGFSQNPRRKDDKTWRYCQEVTSATGRARALQCMFCQQIISGGGINRVKQHLAGIIGNVKSCPKVPPEVRFEMKGVILETAQSKKNKEQIKMDMIDEDTTSPVLGDDVVEIPNPMNNVGGSSKRSKTMHIGTYMKGKTGIDSSQPSIQVKMQSKERWHDTDMAFALWMYDACIPMNAVNSPYFQAAISRIATMGHGYTGPSYHALRVPLLKEAKIQVQLTIDAFRSKWVDTGCTIMSDGWQDQSHRPLINFLVYCPDGISFIKSVNVLDIETNSESLCNLFSEIVEMVGAKNIVHLVTDNASNYKKAGELLTERYPTIYWSPCAAHCINLIMKDMGELPLVKGLATLASRITVFVYNHKWARAWLKNKAGWTEIIRPGDTRFGTTFIALKSLYDRKGYLEAMVISPGFKKFLKTDKGRDVKQIILDGAFWNNCLIVTNIMSPIMRLLRMCDSDCKPSIGYVYEGMWRAINGIKKIFKNKQHLYHTYTNIIEMRWDKMLRKRLHAAAFWLNPAFQYDPESPCKKVEAMTGILDVIEKLLPDVDDIMDEVSMFREGRNSFGRTLAKKNAKTTRPDEWWRLFGSDAPNLQALAIKILSQTASSSGCERNWSVFERIHTKKRNRLEHQRLNDLVFVHYNLRLRNRGKEPKRPYDPIDYECIDKVEFWIVEEEPSGELDYDELEEMLEEELANDENLHSSRGNEVDDMNIIDDPIDLSAFGNLNASSSDGDISLLLRQQRNVTFDENDED